MDIVEDRKRKLKELFPEVFDEGQIDFEKLKNILERGYGISESEEKYEMTWSGKNECLDVIQELSIGTLKPCREDSVDFDTTQNLFIEGDNLEVLKLLQKAYYGKIKMIYIDPPYNTGKEFVYPDKYSESLDTYLKYTGQKNKEGVKFSTNQETDGRFHSRWLSMMYSRLYLARNLLKDDGVIFISIDDNEIHNLRKICDEVFGSENFISCLHVEMSTTQGMKVAAALQCEIVKNAEYVLVYGKNSQFFNFINMLYSGKDWDDHYNIYFDKTKNLKMSLLEHLKQVKDYKNIKAKDISDYYAQDNDFKEYIHSISDKIYRDAMCDIPLKLTSKQRAKLKNGDFIEYKSSKKRELYT